MFTAIRFVYCITAAIYRREEFLEIMDEIIPWEEWVDKIRPYYTAGKRGRPPMGIVKMLRMYLLQSWFNLSDPATADAIYDSYAMRKFTGIDFMTDAVLDETHCPVLPRLATTPSTLHGKPQILCKVGHVFRIIKCQFDHKKTVYRGLKKNENRLYAMFAFANLYVPGMF